MIEQDQQSRLAALESRVAALEAQLAEVSSRSPARLPLPPPPTRSQTPTSVAPPPIPGEVPQPPRPELDTEAILKWGGVGLVVLAVGFAVSTAVRRGWLGPEEQLVGAMLLSLVLILAGLRLRSTRRPWTHALVSAGVAAMFVTFASPLFLDRADADVAYVATVLVALVGLGVGRFIPSEWVAAVALIGGLIGWLVIGDGEPPVTSSGAVLAVAVALVVLAALTAGWFGLRLLVELVGLGGGLALAVGAATGTQQVVTLVAGIVVAAVVLVLPSIGGPIQDGPSFWRHAELVVPTALAPWMFGVLAILFTATTTAAGVVALSCAGGVAGWALLARSRMLHPHFVALLVGASVSLTIGLGLALSTDAAWVAVAVQGAGLVALGRTLDNSVLVFANAAVLTAAAALYALVDGADAWDVDASTGADVARLGVIAGVAAAVWLSGRVETRQIGAVVVLGLVMVWLGSVLVHVPQGQAAVSLSWAVIGVALLVAGAFRKLHHLATVGLVVLAITVGKLLYVDMREVDALWRAGLFLIVGLVLMRLGFLLPKWTEADTPSAAAA